MNVDFGCKGTRILNSWQYLKKGIFGDACRNTEMLECRNPDIPGELSLSEEVEGLLYFFDGSRLVDANVADACKQREVDGA